ncbi:hypothetical protein B0H13DRAFT_2384874 [Mycena leptocephala]|nr:hypothetical protein B0H13DRAFT_2384874 [Mycena leptocephala]
MITCCNYLGVSLYMCALSSIYPSPFVSVWRPTAFICDAFPFTCYNYLRDSWYLFEHIPIWCIPLLPALSQSRGLAKARPNLGESAELQTDLARTSPELG